MSPSEQPTHLDPAVAAAIDQAVRDLRHEMREEVLRMLGAEAREAPQAGEPSELPPPAAAEPVADSVDELKHAAARLDRAGTQAAILDSLCEEAERFASRTAVLLARHEELEIWGQRGFSGAPEVVKGLTVQSTSIRDKLVSASGALPLGAEEGASICDSLNATRPAVALLLPLVIGEQVVAGVYADREEGDGSLNVSALQLLTFMGGQLLESLPVRKRAETATLRVADPGVAAVAAPPEPPVETPAEVALPEPEERTSAAADADELISSASGPATQEPPSDESETVADASGFSPGFETTEIPPLSELGVPDLTKLEEPPPAPEPTAPGPEPEPTAPEPPEPVQEVHAAAQPDPPAPAPPEARTPPEASETTTFEMPTSSQVKPPDDVHGPGWAFSAESSGQTGEEAVHEEARRLARLLVTEIKLYNEEEVEGGRRDSNLYQRLQEDIERSRQIYEDRVSTDVRAGTDYFKEALVRILAGGEEGSLGA